MKNVKEKIEKSFIFSVLDIWWSHGGGRWSKIGFEKDSLFMRVIITSPVKTIFGSFHNQISGFFKQCTQFQHKTILTLD